MKFNKDFYWLLPDYLAQKLDRMIDQYGNEAWFEKAWEILEKQYKQDPKSKWAPVEQVIDYCKRTYDTEPQLNDSITESIHIASDEPASQPAAVAERSEDQPLALTPADISTEATVELNKFGFNPKKKKHRH